MIYLLSSLLRSCTFCEKYTASGLGGRPIIALQLRLSSRWSHWTSHFTNLMHSVVLWRCLCHSQDSCYQTFTDISLWSIVFLIGILYVLRERFSLGTVRTSDDNSLRARGKVFYTLLSLGFGTLKPETLYSQCWIILIAGLACHLLQLREKIPLHCDLSYSPKRTSAGSGVLWYSVQPWKHQHRTYVFVMSEVLIFLAVQQTPMNSFLKQTLNTKIYETVVIVIL